MKTIRDGSMWLNGGRRSYKAASRKIWDLLQPLINALGPPVEYPLDDLHEDDQEDHRHPHQRGNAAVMAVLNGNAAQASGTDHTGDGGIGQNLSLIHIWWKCSNVWS